ncbi:unnamed protein product, partial [Closterium sp. NIES-64]
LAVPPAAPQQATIGVCCLCVRPFDDYSGRNRCAACRMLLLVCPACTQTEVRLPTGMTIGVCCLCAKPFDDYSGRNRCTACRMLHAAARVPYVC